MSAIGNDESDPGDLPTIEVPTTANTPAAVIRFLAEWLVAENQLPNGELEPIVSQVLRRESLGSTGVGGELALPHGASPAIERPALVVGRLVTPLDWDSIDGEPVRVVCLSIGPEPNSAVVEAIHRLIG